MGRGILPAASSRQMLLSHRPSIAPTALASINSGWAGPGFVAAIVNTAGLLGVCLDNSRLRLTSLN